MLVLVMFITTCFVSPDFICLDFVFAADIILSYKQVFTKVTTQLNTYIFRDMQQWANQDISDYPVMQIFRPCSDAIFAE
jgi:hypothetical protein